MAKDTNQFSEIAPGEVLSSGRLRRRWTFMEKLRAAQEASAPGTTVSSVARKYGMAPSQLFRWRKLFLKRDQEIDGASYQVSADGELRELKCRVRELERLLGKATLDNEILRETAALEKTRSQPR